MTSLTLVRRIRARPSIVFDALTTPEGIASWWGPDEGPVFNMFFGVQVRDRKHLANVMRALHRIPEVKRVQRART